MLALRWYQHDACEATWRALCAGPGNPVIVIPTGGGKSLVIAELARKAVREYGGRVLVLAHRKELLQQNAAKIADLLPFGVRCGIFSAGLRRWATEDEVVCAGIQSCHRKAGEFGARQMLIIDEAHLVPDEGMYCDFINTLREINPKLRVVGLTATPFRTATGAVYGPGRLFDRVSFEAAIPPLISEGFLSAVTSRPAEASYDTSRLHARCGEFVAREVEDLFGDGRKIEAACKEIVAACRGRRSVIIFCSGVNHAERVRDCIEGLTADPVGLVTGSTTSLERAAYIEGFKAGRLRWLVNVDVLTTGFDAPGIDAIAVLRATMSPGLFAQMCGRGLRIAPGKSDCLILDFGNNVELHGPIDSPMYGRKPKAKAKDEEGEGGDEEQRTGPTKECPNCCATVGAATMECSCGYRFPERELKHGAKPDTNARVLSAPERWTVEEVALSRHVKAKDEHAPHTLRVDYVCRPSDLPPGGNLPNDKTISEWVCLEHPAGSFANTRAGIWWRAHSKADVPDSIDAAMELHDRGAVVMAARITTVRDGFFYRIVEQEIGELPDQWHDDVVSVPFDESELF